MMYFNIKKYIKSLKSEVKMLRRKGVQEAHGRIAKGDDRTPLRGPLAKPPEALDEPPESRPGGSIPSQNTKGIGQTE